MFFFANKDLDKKFARAHERLSAKDFAHAVAEMKLWNINHFPTFLDKHPENHFIIQELAFTKFWQEKRASLILPQNNWFRFQAQSSVGDGEILMSYLYYQLALQHVEDAYNHKKYLAKAMDLGSIHAYTLNLNHILNQSPDGRHYALLDQELKTMEGKIYRHYTPGFLLMAKGYLCVAQHSEDEAALENFWKTLHIAKYTEKFCPDAIHNAYLGETLADGNPLQHQKNINEIIDDNKVFVAQTISSNRLSDIELDAQQYIKNSLHLDECLLERKHYQTLIG